MSAMAPVDWRNQVETYLASNPRFGSQNLAVVLRVLEIIVGVMFSHFPVNFTMRTRGAEGGVLFDPRWRTCQRRETFGHRSGSLEALWPIFLTITQLFWFVKVNITNGVS